MQDYCIRLPFRFKLCTAARNRNRCSGPSSYNISYPFSLLVPRGCPNGLHHGINAGYGDSIRSTSSDDRSSAWPALLCPHQTEALVRCDQAIDKGFSTQDEADYIQQIVDSQHKHSKRRCKGSRPDSDNSISLQCRQAMSHFQGVPHHTPVRPAAEGDDLALLFRSLFKNLKCLRFIDRDSCTSGHLPSSAKSAETFHGSQWRNFAQLCDPPWLEMDPVQKCDTVFKFFFYKFSRCKHYQAMWPADKKNRKQRSDICWNKFYFKDTEYLQLHNTMMSDYHEARDRYEQKFLRGVEQVHVPGEDSGWDAT